MTRQQYITIYVKGGLFTHNYHKTIQTDFSEENLNEWISYASNIGTVKPEICTLVGSELNESIIVTERQLIAWLFAIFRVQEIGRSIFDLSCKYGNFDIADYIINICEIPIDLIVEKYPAIIEYMNRVNPLIKAAHCV